MRPHQGIGQGIPDGNKLIKAYLRLEFYLSPEHKKRQGT